MVFYVFLQWWTREGIVSDVKHSISEWCCDSPISILQWSVSEHILYFVSY